LIGDSCLSAIVGIGKWGGHFGHKWRRRGSRHHNIGVTLQTRRADDELMARGRFADGELMARRRCVDDKRTMRKRCANESRTEHERCVNGAATTTWNKKVTWLF